jgi:hypothetical protein
MKKLFVLGVLLLVSVGVLGPSQGKAFNSGTHIYIAERVFPFAFEKINLYYGSIAPDLSMYVNQPQNWPDAFMETHYSITLPYEWWDLTQRAFAKGWQTHNEQWGADFYAHGRYPNYNGYVITQAIKLATIPDFEIYLDKPPYYELAHFAIEVAIDLLLARYHDPSLGVKLLWAAEYRSQKDLNLMLKTFVTDEGPNAETLQEAEYAFRELVIAYAKALALPDPLRMLAISELGVQIAAQMGVSLTPYQVWEILRVAMYLCQNPNDMGVDYMEVIQAAIEGIRTNHELIR